MTQTDIALIGMRLKVEGECQLREAAALKAYGRRKGFIFRPPEEQRRLKCSGAGEPRKDRRLLP
jgi:hypothetical protein